MLKSRLEIGFTLYLLSSRIPPDYVINGDPTPHVLALDSISRLRIFFRFLAEKVCCFCFLCVRAIFWALKKMATDSRDLVQFALPKGHMQTEVFRLMADAGYKVRETAQLSVLCVCFVLFRFKGTVSGRLCLCLCLCLCLSV